MKINEDGSYASGPAKKPKPSLKLPGKSLVLVLVVVLLAILVMDSFYTLKEDQYAVITTFGKPTTVSTSGLKFKLPFVQQVAKVSKTIQGFPLGYRINSKSTWTSMWSTGLPIPSSSCTAPRIRWASSKCSARAISVTPSAFTMSTR